NERSFGFNAVLVIFFPTSPPALSVGRFVGKGWQSIPLHFSAARLLVLRTRWASHQVLAFSIVQSASDAPHTPQRFRSPFCAPSSLLRPPSSLALRCIAFVVLSSISPFGASLDTAILSYSPVQETGTIIQSLSLKRFENSEKLI